MHHRPPKLKLTKLNTIQEMPSKQSQVVEDIPPYTKDASPPVVSLDDAGEIVPLGSATMPLARHTSPWLIVLGAFLSNSASFGMFDLDQ